MIYEKKKICRKFYKKTLTEWKKYGKIKELINK